MRYGQSAVKAFGRRDRGCSDDVVISVPVARIVSTIDLVLTRVLRDSVVASSVLGEARGSARGLAVILTRSLDLAATLAEIAGAALLPYSAQVRRWLEILTEVAPATHWRHCASTSNFIIVLVQASPAMLIQKPLIERLVNFAVAMMQPTQRALSQGPAGASSSSSSQVQDSGSTHSRRKRKPAQAFGDAGGAAAADQPICSSSSKRSQEVFPWGCRMLASLLELSAPMLGPPQVAATCERIVRTLWLGLLTPTPDQVGDGLGQATDVMAHQQLCRDAPSILALIAVVEALHQTPRPGVMPLAPSLRDAFAALLNTVTAAYQRRVVQNTRAEAAPPAISPSLQAMHVRDTLLTAASWPAHIGHGLALDGSIPGISIFWPADSKAETVLPAVMYASSTLIETPDVVMAEGQDGAATVAKHQPGMTGETSVHDEVVPDGLMSSQALQSQLADSVDSSLVSAQLPPCSTELSTPSVLTEKMQDRIVEPPNDIQQCMSTPAVTGSEEPVMPPAPTATSEQTVGSEPCSTERRLVAAVMETSNVPAAMGSAEPDLTTGKENDDPKIVEIPLDKPGEGASLELFPDSDASPIPELCMDSPSGEEV